MTKTRIDNWSELCGVAFRHWGAKPDGNFLDIACKQNLLYQVNAAAIKYATQHIKKKIAVAKAGFLDAIVTEGHQGVAAILQRAKKAGIGDRGCEPVQRPLPLLLHPQDGRPAESKSDRDEIWLTYLAEQECGDII